MARGTALLALVEDLREEVGRSSSVAVGKADLAGLKQKLRRVQEMLYDEYDWPFLREIFTLNLAAGDRYYDLPTGLHLERIEAVDLWNNNFPVPIKRGITPADYAVYNSIATVPVRSDPVLKWDVRWTGAADQIEVWPIPSGNTQFITFTGIRNLRALVADTDVADLDDHLIVLWAAGEILLRQGAANASMVVKLAQQRLGTVKKRSKGAESVIRMGMGAPAGDQRIPIVVVARSA